MKLTLESVDRVMWPCFIRVGMITQVEVLNKTKRLTLI